MAPQSTPLRTSVGGRSRGESNGQPRQVQSGTVSPPCDEIGAKQSKMRNGGSNLCSVEHQGEEICEATY